MPTVVVPFRGETAKQRLAPAPDEVRAALAEAMLADVLDAARALGPVVVVNADLPCARPRDLLTLLGALPAGGIALAPAADGTTNALALAAPHLFAPLYGPGSAERFLVRAERLGVPAAVATIPNLADDVD